MSLWARGVSSCVVYVRGVWWVGMWALFHRSSFDSLGLGPVGGVELQEPADERGDAGPVHGGEGVVRALHHRLAQVLDAVEGMVCVLTRVSRITHTAARHSPSTTTAQ